MDPEGPVRMGTAEAVQAIAARQVMAIKYFWEEETIKL